MDSDSVLLIPLHLIIFAITEYLNSSLRNDSYHICIIQKFQIIYQKIKRSEVIKSFEVNNRFDSKSSFSKERMILNDSEK